MGNASVRYDLVDSNNGGKDIVITCAWLCAKLELSKGLPDRIIMYPVWLTGVQPLDYKNIALCCRIFHVTAFHGKLPKNTGLFKAQRNTPTT
jgi:hypothetical protein